LKLNFVYGADTQIGYINVNLLTNGKYLSNTDFIVLPYGNDSVSSINIVNVLSQINFNALDSFFSELNRIIIKDSELNITFLAFDELLSSFNCKNIGLAEFNNILFGNNQNLNSILDTKELINILLKYKFEIFEMDSSKSKPNDYYITIKSKCRKISTLDNDDSKNFDIDLFNEVSKTIKHPENFNIDLLNEVMDYNSDTDYEIQSKSSSLDEIMNFDFTQESESNNLLDEVLNFNFETEHNILEGNKQADDNLLDEVLNFNISQSSDNPNQIPESENEINSTNKVIKMNSPSINVVWEGSQFVYNTLANVNREICTILINSGVANVTILPYEADDSTFNKQDINPVLQANDIRNKPEVPSEISKLPYSWIRHQFPPKNDPPKGAKWIIMQSWDYSKLSPEILNTLLQANEVWTPSFFSRKILIDAGLDFNKVQVIPRGINPSIFSPYGNKYHLNTNKKQKFLFVGPTNFRKGFDILLQAFKENFNSEDDVCLVVKDFGTDEPQISKTENDIREFRNSDNSPEIIYIKDNLSTTEMSELYRSCDVVVSPYRAESFGVSLLEAMACGLPVIATKGGAPDEFLEEAFTKFISSELIPYTDLIDGIKLIDIVNILEPSLEDLKNAMMDFYNNPGIIASMGAVASAYTRSKWTWEKSVVKILRRLDYLYGTQMSSAAEIDFKDILDDSMIFGSAEHTYIEGDFDNAVELFLESIKGDVPNNYKVLGMHRIAMILINKGEFKAAGEILESVSILHPNHPDSLYTKVIINAANNQHTEALENISLLLDDWKSSKFISQLGHSHDDLIVLTADLLLAENDLESAHSLYTTALSMNNNNIYACYGAGMCFKLSGFIDESKEMFEWALKLNPDFEDAKKELNSLL
jgi:glycosyltransferase involved in cell wall biosynthesis